MPSRNTPQQLDVVRSLCEKHGLFQISGEDINNPRQNFICKAQRASEFANLYTAALALIGHEKATAQSLDNSMFSEKTVLKYPDLNKRIEYFSKLC